MSDHLECISCKDSFSYDDDTGTGLCPVCRAQRAVGANDIQSELDLESYYFHNPHADMVDDPSLVYDEVRDIYEEL